MQYKTRIKLKLSINKYLYSQYTRRRKTRKVFCKIKNKKEYKIQKEKRQT